MKIKSEDILKPGAKLIVEVIDWELPEYKAMLARWRKEDRERKKIVTYRYDQFGFHKRIH